MPRLKPGELAWCHWAKRPRSGFLSARMRAVIGAERITVHMTPRQCSSGGEISSQNSASHKTVSGTKQQCQKSRHVVFFTSISCAAMPCPLPLPYCYISPSLEIQSSFAFITFFGDIEFVCIFTPTPKRTLHFRTEWYTVKCVPCVHQSLPLHIR